MVVVQNGIEAPEAPGEKTHEEEPGRQGQKAERHASKEVGLQDGLKHGQHGLKPFPGHKAPPGDLMPAHGAKVDRQPPPPQEAPEVYAGGGDGDQGPGVIDEGRGQHQGAVQATEQGAGDQHHHRVESQKGIEGDGKADGEAPGHLILAEFGVDDVRLGSSP